MSRRTHRNKNQIRYEGHRPGSRIMSWGACIRVNDNIYLDGLPYTLLTPNQARDIAAWLTTTAFKIDHDTAGRKTGKP